MKRGDGAILLITLVVLWPSLLLAQKPPSLEEQLRAQYDPATILTIQKQGVFGVASTSSKLCAVRYQDGKLNPAESSCLATLNSATRTLTVGEKINPSNIDVDLAKERISFRIVECDSCNKGVQSASFKSQIDFQFAKGYLERADVPQVVDAISEVLAFPDVAVEQPPQPPNPPGQPGDQTSGVLTNNDIVKMVKVNLRDDIIISTIRSSQCDFDTTVNGMVKLKTAGVSDAVIQAMREAQAKGPDGPDTPPKPPEPKPGPNPAPGQNFSVRHRHLNLNSSVTYCSGTLSVSPDGTVAYDCTQGDDLTGRCDHVSFAPGSLKQAKVGIGGNLHIASKAQGNYDFYGDDVRQAQAAIAPFVQAAQK
jgi:hypothetical protein